MAVKPTAGTHAGEGVDSAELARQIAELRADLAALTESLGDLAQGKASGLLDQLHARMAELGGTAEAAMKDKLAGGVTEPGSSCPPATSRSSSRSNAAR